ncbi:hypothetical protein HPB48_003120 [Haemaphysalis longicornis]|uniref:Cystathionine beta-synthase n=1 Tax=Haemaphysalis longicornis TaxID=44386 RepID=A0A9J6FYD5_HAELO|nr:hypothetical protein HPB48_003120 [Haemaphysalis longicornis]
MAAAIRGYRCIIVLPEKMSREKVDVLRALGAEIVRTPTSARYDSAESHISVAFSLCREIPGAVILDQIVGVDPHGSELAVDAEPNDPSVTMYEVEGIGYDFVPTVLDRSLVDKWYKCNDKDSFLMARKLIRQEGLLCGGSSGSAMSVAVEAAKSLKAGQKCVVILPDGVRNYMTKFLSDSWMAERGFISLYSEMSTKHWWWNQTVRALRLRIPLTVTPTVTCQDAVELMSAEGIDQLPVVDESGCFKYRRVLKIFIPSASSATVKDAHFEVFVIQQIYYGNIDNKMATGTSTTKEVVIGIVTNIDLLRFITKGSRTKADSTSVNGDKSPEINCSK